MTTLTAALGDGAVITRRNVIKIKRVPDLLIIGMLSPIMFVLLFAYVFGSAVVLPGGGDYREFLMAGIFTQTVVLSTTITGVGLAEDMQKGIIDRFRTLPISRSAVLVGRTTSDLVNNLLVVATMSLAGLVVGWRVNTSVGEALLGFALLLAFAYAVSWIMAVVGLAVRSPEVVNNASFVVVFALTFVANTFVPSEGLPGPLRVFAQWNPVSAVTEAVRQLFGNNPPGYVAPDVWPLQNPIAASLGWIVVILLVFVPLSVQQYQKATSR
ncbi:MAG: ABC transporter permease [Pseudonocardia sp.]|nr:ABC transporter permease [Pseudonocardia sp.]